MQTYLDEALERDIERIREHVADMSRCAEKSLSDCVVAMTRQNRKLAYAVILRDQFIDEKEKEIDRLCLEFLVRQQPVSLPLRFVYSTIRINLEIERIGDYAESIARHILKLGKLSNTEVMESIMRLAEVSISMFRDATLAYMEKDPELAVKSSMVQPAADAMRNQLNSQAIERIRRGELPLEQLVTLLTIIRRFERVADQARNICLEVQYMCTGEIVRHKSSGTFRMLFIDDHNSCKSQMAEAIANSLNQTKFIFGSAGIEPRPVDVRTLEFMKEKGFDLSKAAPKGLSNVPNLEYYQVVVMLSANAQKALPDCTRKVICIDWLTDDPSCHSGPDSEITQKYEDTFQFLESHITDLVAAITDADIERESS